MSKPIPAVRVILSEQSEKFARQLALELAKTMKFILGGKDVVFSPFTAFSMPIDAYLQSYKKKSVMIKISVENDSRKIYAFFEFDTVIVMAGFLRQQPEGAILECVSKQVFDDKAADAFGEVTNQFTGALDLSLRFLTNAEVHLVLDFEKKIYPDESIKKEHFVDDEEYIVWITTIAIPNFTTQKLTFLIPQSLFENLLGIEPKIIVIYSWDKELVDEMADKIESRYWKVDRAQDYGDILHMAKDERTVAVCIDFETVPAPLPHQFKIFGKRLASNEGFLERPVWTSFQTTPEIPLEEFGELGFKGVTDKKAREYLLPWIKEQQAISDATDKEAAAKEAAKEEANIPK